MNQVSQGSREARIELKERHVKQNLTIHIICIKFFFKDMLDGEFNILYFFTWIV